jgi:AcrR family transcriptional regulator
MPAADRRRAILDVVIPLLIEKGPAITTAEMAKAANIAEGTIFRVFPDKPAVIFEAVKVAMDPAPAAREIGAISSSASMRNQLGEAARVLHEHFARMTALGESLSSVAALRSAPAGDSRARDVQARGTQAQGAQAQDVHELIKESAAVISMALMKLFERHRAVLRVSPAEAAAAFRGLVFASGHPLLPPEERLPIDKAVSILLAGITKRGRA